MRTLSRDDFPDPVDDDASFAPLSARVGLGILMVLLTGLWVGTWVWLAGLALVDADVVSRWASWWVCVRVAVSAAFVHVGLRAITITRADRD